MPKSISAEAKPRSPEQLHRLEDADPEKGLASFAGGWDGTDELVEETGKTKSGIAPP